MSTDPARAASAAMTSTRYALSADGPLAKASAAGTCAGGGEEVALGGGVSGDGVGMTMSADGGDGICGIPVEPESPPTSPPPPPRLPVPPLSPGGVPGAKPGVLIAETDTRPIVTASL